MDHKCYLKPEEMQLEFILYNNFQFECCIIAVFNPGCVCGGTEHGVRMARIQSILERAFIINSTQTAVAFGITAVVSTGAMAVGNSIEDTHYFRLGYLSQNADVSAQSTIDPLPPIEIDLTDDLNMDDDSQSFQLNYRWRFAEKWSFSVIYQKLELDGNGEAGFDFNFDGKPYIAGATVDTQFDMDTYLVDVNYSFVRSDKWELSVGGGLHAFDFDVAMKSTITLEGDGEGESIVEETAKTNADVLAPLPNLRGGATYLISPRWEVNASVGWLSLEIDNIDGSYTYLDVGTEYRFTDRFGIGASYQYSKVDVTSTNNDSVDKFDVKFSGPSIYLSYGF